MKGLFFDGKNLSYSENLPCPVPNFDEALIKVKFSAICNTDREIIKGYKNFRGILGHEFIGVVVESKQTSLIGQRVVGELNIGCGQCDYCKSGLEKHCKSRKALGITGYDGCFAEYITLPNRLIHPVPSSLADNVAIYCEPLAAAINAVEQARLALSDSVLILGDGRLAYMIYCALVSHSNDITVLGHSASKLDNFKQYATACTFTEREFDVVFEATGASNGIIYALSHVKSGGRVVLKSTTAENVTLNMSQVVVNEITIIGSRCGNFEKALTLLQTNKLPLPKIELYSLSNFEQAFNSKAFKVGFFD
ncbi:MAG: alcohol dehydrogenase catalytic domain-containing protein [Clostridia bacterium]